MTHRMIVHDAKEFAGVFYERNRSVKFRTTWPDQREFVKRNWQNFVVHVRLCYAEMLTKGDVPQHQKDKIYDALVADAKAGNASEGAALPLQLAPNSQGFEGDRKENFLTDESFGKHSHRSLKRMLRDGSALH